MTASGFPVSPSPSDPLVLKTKKGISKNDETITTTIEQTLAGRTYRIEPSKVASPSKNAPIWKNALKGSAIILATPVLIPSAILYTFSMYVGPSWWRNQVLSKMVTMTMKMVNNLFADDRRELLKAVQPGDVVLDLGAGSGYYLKYLSRAGRIVALEPCPNFHDMYRRHAIDAGLKERQVEVYASTIESYVQDYPQQHSTFDWVILGNVLCEVDDQHSTLRGVHHLLKPGGHVYFSEHIGAPQGTWARQWQDLVNPIWRTAGAGCNCNRDSLANIRSMKQWDVISWHYHGFQVMMGPFVLGLALKNDTEMGSESTDKLVDEQLLADFD